MLFINLISTCIGYSKFRPIFLAVNQTNAKIKMDIKRIATKTTASNTETLESDVYEYN